MRGVVKRCRWPIVVLACAGALFACGGGPGGVHAGAGFDPAPPAAPPTTVVVGTVPSIRMGANDHELVLTMTSIPAVPPGDPCEANVDIEPYVQPREIVLSVTVNSAVLGADLASCRLTGSRDVKVELPEPAAGRPVTFNVTGTPQRFVGDASRGYAECGPPSCDPTAKIAEAGTCSNLREFATLADAPKNFAMVDVRCEESFAVYGLDFGSGACPPSEGQRSPCAGKSVHRFYWRATDTGWTIIADDDSAGCGQVPTKAPDFPISLCADLPAVAGG